jgi:hypothetical protein
MRTEELDSIAVVEVEQYAIGIPEGDVLDGDDYGLQAGKPYTIYLVNRGTFPCSCDVAVDGGHQSVQEIQAASGILVDHGFSFLGTKPVQITATFRRIPNDYNNCEINFRIIQIPPPFVAPVEPSPEPVKGPKRPREYGPLASLLIIVGFFASLIVIVITLDAINRWAAPPVDPNKIIYNNPHANDPPPSRQVPAGLRYRYPH